MPHVEEMLEKIGQAWFILTLDLMKGHWLILMAREDKEKTAFGNPWGLFQFWLHGVAASFQRLMD